MSESVKRSLPCPSIRAKALKVEDGRMMTTVKDQASWSIQMDEMRLFLRLIETDERIVYLLNFDFCNRIADKYLLAMVFVYFKRAKLRPHQFDRRHFYVALFLAHDMEEENDEVKVELLKWALGYKWSSLTYRFLRAREQLWNQMNFRAIVSRKLCDKIMSLLPEHSIWKRQRLDYHAGAIRASSAPYSPPSYNCTLCLLNAHVNNRDDEEQQILKEE